LVVAVPVVAPEVHKSGSEAGSSRSKADKSGGWFAEERKGKWL
jgi:hypothetical protein